MTTTKKAAEARMLAKAAKQSSTVRGWTGGGARGAAARRLFNLCRKDASARHICRSALRSQAGAI